MAAVNCPRCGRAFQVKDTEVEHLDKVCPKCERIDEDTFQVIKKYLEENPMATVTDVVEDTGISVKTITRFLRQGRLEVTQGMSGFLKCLKCGTPIRTGKYCDVCEMYMIKKFNHSLKERVVEHKNMEIKKKESGSYHIRNK
ncbi:MAG: flagellar protein [Firmicutes bacterium]|nr:flagellar protein [Bacillota bacterium]